MKDRFYGKLNNSCSMMLTQSYKFFFRSGKPSLIATLSFFFSALAALLLPLSAPGQDTEAKTGAVVVQPGPPGQPSKRLPASTRAQLPPRSAKDVGFMQGMIMHHAQAVEMVDLMEERTGTRSVLLLGARIRQSQSDEINFMKRWLRLRGESDAMKTDMSSKGMSSHRHHMLMPGMLTEKQMLELKEARGSEFDRLFLRGMIQHHRGALAMVDELFKTAGAGQDAELFNFATDVDSGQRAEIRIMETMLDAKP